MTQREVIHAAGNGRKKLAQWSYSRLASYETCALQVKFKVVDGLADPPNPAMERGSYWHEGIAAHLQTGAMIPAATNGSAAPLLFKYEQLFSQLRERPDLAVELKVGITRQWTETGFFASNVWGRVVYDVKYCLDEHVVVIDWKTGKPYPATHMEQLELYAAAALVQHPEKDVATARHEYIDIGPQASLCYTLGRDKLEEVQAKWAARALRMEHESTFAANPGPHCARCPYRRGVGPCQFGG